MDIHEVVRLEKRRWRKIREGKNHEAIRQGYNDLKLSTIEVVTDTVKDYCKWICNLLKDRISLDSRVLDAGSGDGIMCRELQKNGFTDITGFDISDVNVEATLRYTKKAFRAGCEDIPKQDNSYDAVICNGVIEHVMEIEKSLSELYRVLKPDGFLYLMTDNAIWHTITAIRNPFMPEKKKYKRFVQPLDGDFSPREFHKLLISKGFNNIEFYALGALPIASHLIEKVLGKPVTEHEFLKYITARFAFLAQAQHPAL